MSSPPLRVIYLVDDDASLRRGLARLLTAAGYAVETYPSAAGLLAAPHPLARGCLITDLRMPGMSGLDLQVALTSRGAAGRDPGPTMDLEVTRHGSPAPAA